MATNPFEDEDGRYYALINDEGQYSLWPTFADVPDGWSIAHGEDSRQACLDYIEENWTDMRPNSLIRQMQEYEESKKLFRFARSRTLTAAGPRPARSRGGQQGLTPAAALTPADVDAARSSGASPLPGS